MQNAVAQSTMLQYEEQSHGTTYNATEQRTMPWLEEQCHGIPSHGKNAMAQCTKNKLAFLVLSR